MNSYVNMGLGALLGTVFVLMTVSIASEGLFHAEIPEKPGYVIAAADADASAEAADAPAAAVPVAQLMASADPANGEKLFKKCAANKVGPNLFGVVGRPVAALPDFSYSAGMKEFSKGGQETWSFDNLNHFLTAPKKFIKGTAMGYAGDKKDKERADIMAYLNSKSDSPLPAPTE
jgi:cytochrome c